MNVNFICVGKIKEWFFEEAVNEYKKRLTAFCKVKIIETKDYVIGDSSHPSDIALAKQKEGEKILPHLKGYIILLDLNGVQQSSEEFSKFIDKKMVDGESEITFVIGGSHGVSRDVEQKADYNLCFGKMTFPHQLMRVVLCEQVYRAFMIKAGKSYHK